MTTFLPLPPSPWAWDELKDKLKDREGHSVLGNPHIRRAMEKLPDIVALLVDLAEMGVQWQETAATRATAILDDIVEAGIPEGLR